METREDLTEKEIEEIETMSKKFGGKSIRLYTKDEVLDEADSNHIWLNAFSCIHPTPAFAQDLGMSILHKLSETKMRDFLGISNEIILTINKS